MNTVETPLPPHWADLLEKLAAHVGIRFDRAAAALAWARTSGADWGPRLARVGNALGLEIRPLLEDTASLGRLIGPQQPILGLQPDGRWILFCDARGGLLRYEDSSGDAWRTPKKVAELWGLAGEDTPAAWWSVAARADSPHDHHPSPFSRLLGLLRGHRQELATILTYALAVGLLSLVLPVTVQALVGTVAFGTVLQPVLVLAVVVAAGLALSATLSSLEIWVVEVLQRRMFVRLLADLAARLPRVLGERWFAGHGPERVNRFYDLFVVHKALSLLLLDGLALVLRISVGLVLLAFYHPLLLAFDVVLVLGLVVVLFALGKNAVATALEESRQKHQTTAWLEDLARHPGVWRSPSGGRWALDTTEKVAREWLFARRAHFRVLLRQVIGSLGLQVIASAGLLGLGGWMVIEGQLTLGQLVAAELVVSGVVGGFTKAGKHLETTYDLLAGVDKLGYLLDLPVEPEAGETKPIVGASNLELREITAGPEGPLLQDASFTLSSKQHAAIYGPAGSGKSYLADMLQGLRTFEGQVLLDGLPLSDWAPAAMRQRVLVLRAGELFGASLLDNVRLGAVVGPSEIRSALSRVGLSDKKQKLEQQLLPGGAPLSDSERTQVLLARAWVQQPSLLVIDGLLDGLDPDLTGQIQRFLTDPAAPWTALILTRRPELASTFSVALQLREGRLEEMSCGTS